MANFSKQLISINNLASIVMSPVEILHLSDEKHVGSITTTVKHTIVKSQVEKVTHIDEKVIELVLKSGIDRVQPTAGFLVEIFSSGSDGKLFRLFEEDVVDLHGNTTEEGFSKYFLMDLDK